MYLPYDSVHLGDMIVLVIVASLEARTCRILPRNPPISQTNLLQLPNEPSIHSVK